MQNEEELTYNNCTNPDCRVAETGRCVEGLDLNSCTNYGQGISDDVTEDDSEGNEDAQEEAYKNVLLPSAATLSRSEASSVLRQGNSRVIAVLGPSDSGKTSLIASLYDLFQQGPVEGIEFVRSRTLHAFEESCHNARAASRRTEPEMDRTPHGEVQFYHLEIGGFPDEKHSTSLLLGDRAGEEYLAARNYLDIVADFAEVIRADTLTVLVDGERLLDTKRRHNLLIDIKMVLQALHDGEALRTGARLALVLTKLDVVSSSEHKEQALKDFITLARDIERLFGEALTEVMSFKVAASPKTSALKRGTGVCELLKFWLSATDAAHTPAPSYTTGLRVFSRLRSLDEHVGEPHD